MNIKARFGGPAARQPSQKGKKSYVPIRSVPGAVKTSMRLSAFIIHCALLVPTLKGSFQELCGS